MNRLTIIMLAAILIGCQAAAPRQADKGSIHVGAGHLVAYPAGEAPTPQPKTPLPDEGPSFEAPSAKDMDWMEKKIAKAIKVNIEEQLAKHPEIARAEKNLSRLNDFLEGRQIRMGDSTPGYAEALEEAKKSGKPLVVLVGTDWCPGCLTMKHRILPKLRAAGKLDGVIYCVVDADDEPDTAAKLMSGKAIPQLLVYANTAKGWKAERFIDAQSAKTIEAAIDRAVKASH